MDAYGGESPPYHLLGAKDKWTVKIFFGVLGREVWADPVVEDIKSDSRGRQCVLGIQSHFCHQFPKQS